MTNIFLPLTKVRLHYYLFNIYLFIWILVFGDNVLFGSPNWPQTFGNPPASPPGTLRLQTWLQGLAWLGPVTKDELSQPEVCCLLHNVT